MQAAVTTLVGIEAVDWSASLVVDIISSNRTSVVDLLSPYTHLPVNRQRILRWAETEGLCVQMSGGATSGSGAESEADTDNEADADNRYYVLADKYFVAHPDEAIARSAYDRKRGIMAVEELEYTGISVQIVCMDQLLKGEEGGFHCDSVLRHAVNDKNSPSGAYADDIFQEKKRHVIVNIDYAFGEQAEHVLWSLLNLFSLSVRSVNVMGKVSMAGSVA